MLSNPWFAVFKQAFLPVLVVTVLSASGAAAASGNDPPPDSSPEQAAKTPPRGQDFVVVEGQVTDSMGGGQKAVVVTVYRKRTDGSRGERLGSTTTNKLGDFAVTAPKAIRGDIIVTLTKPLFSDLTREFHLVENAPPPYLAESLVGKLVMIGRVVDELTTKPVPGAAVKLTSMDKDWHTKTDQLGRFTFKGVSPGRGDLVIEAEGFGREHRTISRLEDFGEVVIAIKPERVVHLSVVDELDQPIAGVTVEAYDGPRNDFRTVVTDQKGSATLRGIHFDATTLSLRLSHKDHVSDTWFDRDVVMTKKERESTHKLRMLRAATITGRVSDVRTAAPLYGAKVITGHDSVDTSPRDWTGEGGRFTVTGVKPGLVVVTVHFAGFAPDLKRIKTQPGKIASVDFKLAPGAVLKGIVKSEKGEPLSGVFVDATRWRGEDTLGLRAVTGSDGRFTIDSAPRDEFDLVVYRNPISQLTKTVKAEASGIVEIVLPEAQNSGLSPDHLKVGDPAPEVKLTTLSGQRLNPADLKGKTLLLDFWATWCGPCVAELPHLKKVSDTFGSRKDFIMVSVSLDEDEQTLRRFIKKHDMKWPQVFGTLGGASSAADKYGVSGIPALFIIGADGKLRGTNVVGADLLKRLDRVLKNVDSS